VYAVDRAFPPFELLALLLRIFRIMHFWAVFNGLWQDPGILSESSEILRGRQFSPLSLVSVRRRFVVSPALMNVAAAASDPFQIPVA